LSRTSGNSPRLRRYNDIGLVHAAGAMPNAPAISLAPMPVSRSAAHRLLPARTPKSSHELNRTLVTALPLARHVDE
jgi:hypothetical protein